MLYLKFKYSYFLCLLLLVLYILVISAVLVTSWPIYDRLVLILICVSFFIRDWRLHITRAHRLAIHDLLQTEAGWFISTSIRSYFPVKLKKYKFLSIYLCIAEFYAEDDNRRYWLIAAYDMLTKDRYRQFRVHLGQSKW